MNTAKYMATKSENSLRLTVGGKLELEVKDWLVWQKHEVGNWAQRGHSMWPLL